MNMILIDSEICADGRVFSSAYVGQKSAFRLAFTDFVEREPVAAADLL